MAGFASALENMGLGGPDVTEDALWEFKTRDDIILYLKDLVADKLDAKEKENPDEWALIERLVLLRTIDSIWVEHLTELDEMRQGIQLRGFAQEDPLNAFKKEAFALYEEMRNLIRHQLATTIFRVSIVRQPVQPEGTEGTGKAPAAGGGKPAGGGARPAAHGGRPLPKAPPAGRAMGGSTGAGGGPGGAIRPGYSPTGARMGRNDRCWCGSGKKYKKCHGR
jgi:preprotein translocase subunit SecA